MSRILQGYLSNVGEQPTIKVGRVVEFNGFWKVFGQIWRFGGILEDDS